MIRRRIALLSLAAALGVPAAARAQIPVPRIAQRAGPAVVSLKTFDARGRELLMGSGFIVRDGRVVTNAHVVEGAARAEVFDAEGRLMGTASHAEALSTRVDLAVLPRLGNPRSTVNLARREPRVGEEVVAIGAPEGLTNTVSNGIVSAYRDVEGQRMMQITAPLSEGSSGGPVLNRRGEVVGVTVAVYEGGQNLNFAVPLEDIRAIVRSPAGVVAFTAAEEGPLAIGGPAADEGDGAARTTGRPRPSTIRVGQAAVMGALQEGDAAFGGGGFFDLYTFRARAGQRLTITLRSDDFDPYLRLAHVRSADDLDWLGEDDGGGPGSTSRLRVTTPVDGEYWIAVSALDEAPGPYELSLREADGDGGDADGGDVGGGDVDGGDVDGGEAVGGDADGGDADGGDADGGDGRAGPAGRWIPAGESASFARFLDRTRVTRQGGEVYRVWVRSVYVQPQTTEAGDTYDMVMSMMDYDCPGRRWRVVQVIQYLGGRVVWATDDEPSDWGAWVPDSVGETTGQAACRLAEQRAAPPASPPR
ncbi:MAG TPA: surface-adhesin E family protein [Longimicrobium sp.]|nr:surface-adhesin E family protein [Longimicrobium sp.]